MNAGRTMRGTVLNHNGVQNGEVLPHHNALTNSCRRLAMAPEDSTGLNATYARRCSCLRSSLQEKFTASKDSNSSEQSSVRGNLLASQLRVASNVAQNQGRCQSNVLRYRTFFQLLHKQISRLTMGLSWILLSMVSAGLQ